MNRTEASLYNPSPVVVGLKRLVALVERVLPPAAFRRFYDTGFAVYRAGLRASYRRHELFARMRGDAAGAHRAATVHRVMPYSLVGASGLEATYDAVTTVESEGIPGAIVECGVAQGGCAALMALTTERAGNGRHLWLFDSYEGLPPATDKDYEGSATGHHVRALPPGSCLGTLEQVEGLLFDRLRLDRSRIRLVKGWFENTLAPTAPTVGAVAILRIDADWYESVKCCLDVFFEAVSPRGCVIIDDYGTCFGARKAVDEFLAARKLAPELTPDGRGGIVFRKP